MDEDPIFDQLRGMRQIAKDYIDIRNRCVDHGLRREDVRY